MTHYLALFIAEYLKPKYIISQLWTVKQEKCEDIKERNWQKAKWVEFFTVSFSSLFCRTNFYYIQTKEREKKTEIK